MYILSNCDVCRLDFPPVGEQVDRQLVEFCWDQRTQMEVPGNRSAEILYMDKLIDELARGKAMEKILRDR